MDLHSFRKSFSPDPDKWAAKRTPAIVIAVWACAILGVILIACRVTIGSSWLLTGAGLSLGAAFALWYMTKPPSDDE